MHPNFCPFFAKNSAPLVRTAFAGLPLRPEALSAPFGCRRCLLIYSTSVRDKAMQKCNFVTYNFVTFWCFQKVQTKFIINIYIIIYILIILYTLIIKLLFFLSCLFPAHFPFLPIKNRQKVTSYKVTSLYSKINVRVGRDALLYAPLVESARLVEWLDKLEFYGSCLHRVKRDGTGYAFD